MKTDCEFIDGIYEKAKTYDDFECFNNLTFLNNTSSYQKQAKFQLVACLALVLLVGINFSNSNFIRIDRMELPELSYEYQDLSMSEMLNTTIMQRTATPMSIGLTEEVYYNNVEEADVICTAKVLKIEKSVYDEETHLITTNVLLKPNETIKGSLNHEFELSVVGGFDDSSKVYLDYEAVFELEEEVLLFLETSHSNTNLYILAGDSHGKYSLENDDLYVNLMGEYYTIDNLKYHFNQ